MTASLVLQSSQPVALQLSRTTLAAVGLLGFYVGFVALLGYWVHRDATAHGESPTSWVLVSLLVPFGVVFYLYRRRQWPRQQPRTDRLRAVETVLLAAVGGFVVGVFGAPPDPISQAVLLIVVTVALLPTAYLFYYHDGVARLREAL